MSWISQRWNTRQVSPPERIAFVLSGGASKGALQVGMLRALLERRIKPDFIVGCSVGALNGALLAGDPSLAAVGRLQDIWLDLDEADVFPSGLLPSTVQLARKGAAIHSPDGLRSVVEAALPAETFEELRVPFECVATDLEAATSRWFRTGPLLEAIMASAAIPVVFPPVEIDGRRYIDGAVVDDVPMSRAVELGATRIYVLQVGNFDRPRVEPRRPVDMAMQAFWINRRHRFYRDLALIPDPVEVIVLPTGEMPTIRFNDLAHGAQLMDLAYRASADDLDRRAGRPVTARETSPVEPHVAALVNLESRPPDPPGEGEPPERRPAYLAWVDRLRQRGEVEEPH